ncbi:MAG TPA: hypothetical protein VGO91_05785 [Pyrinomonadaceae bacterium]|nr:hypothetical protein [Pyrinomonadaceae bacterium]
MASRLINQSEITLAQQVFRDQLPYDKIHFASYYLPNNEGVPTTLASVSSLVPIRSLRSYTIYFGPTVFSDGADVPGTRNTLIHELTHVWQGHHSQFAWEYMINSLLAQGHAILKDGNRNRAYDYAPGKPWGDYNVEQQASIVEDWFRNGMRQDDELFAYITDHIRAGRN